MIIAHSRENWNAGNCPSTLLQLYTALAMEQILSPFSRLISRTHRVDVVRGERGLLRNYKARYCISHLPWRTESLNHSKPDPIQIFKGWIVESRITGRVLPISRRNDDYHALAGAS